MCGIRMLVWCVTAIAHSATVRRDSLRSFGCKSGSSRIASVSK